MKHDETSRHLGSPINRYTPHITEIPREFRNDVSEKSTLFVLPVLFFHTHVAHACHTTSAPGNSVSLSARDHKKRLKVPQAESDQIMNIQNTTSLKLFETTNHFSNENTATAHVIMFRGGESADKRCRGCGGMNRWSMRI